MKTESSTNSPTATLAPTKSQRDPVGLQATSTPSHLTGDLRTVLLAISYTDEARAGVPEAHMHKLITVDSGGCGTPQFVLAN